MTTWANRLTGTTGVDLSVANSAASGDALRFVVKGASSTAKYATLPWGGTGVALVISGASDATYIRWDDKGAENTATRGLVVFPIYWAGSVPAVAVNLAQIRDTSGSSSMAALGMSGTSAGKLVAAQSGGTPLPATLSSTTLVADHLYWAGLAVSKGAAGAGVVEWILWDSDRTTVLETKSATTATTSTAAPGEFRTGAPASATLVPRTHYLSSVQAGHYASGWPTPIPPAAPVVESVVATTTGESFSTATVTATLAAGSAAPDSWTWTQTSGPTVTLSGSGASRTFELPALMDGGTITIQATATKDSVSHSMSTTVTVHPHGFFWTRSTATDWLPVRAV